MNVELVAPIFRHWQPKYSSVWQTQPLRLTHNLHELPLFSRTALAELVEKYPTEKCTLVHMGEQGDQKQKLWRNGIIGGASGAQVLDAIAAGRLWINLRHVNDVDRRYSDLLDRIFEELNARVPGYTAFSRFNGILISSPGAQVYYHFDACGQSLWQIEGTKRLYLYPPVPPFLTDESLEHVALYRDEVGISYERGFDEYASVFELHPGQMMHWPLNSPHRVENLDCLNISMTAEYFTQDIRRKQILNTANAILRQKFGINPRRSISGPDYWSKALFQAAVWRAGLLDGERSKRLVATFKLDPVHPGQIIDL